MTARLGSATGRGPGAIGGIFGGTGLVALAHSLPTDSVVAKVLVAVAPTATIVVSWIWNLVWYETSTRLLLWRRVRLADLIEQDARRTLALPNLDPRVEAEARRNLKLAALARLTAHREALERIRT